MSFFDKMMGRGERRRDDDVSPFDEMTEDNMLLAGDGTATLDMNVATAPLVRESSIITEATASEVGSEFSETRTQVEPAFATTAVAALPLIGKRPVVQQQRILVWLIGLGLAGLVLVAVSALLDADRGATQVSASGQALMQSQRLAKAATQAVIGDLKSFAEARDAVEVLTRNTRSLATGEGDVPQAPAAARQALEPLLPLIAAAETNTNAVIAQQKVLTQVGSALRKVNQQSSEMFETVEAIAALRLQQDASAAEQNALGQLLMLSQRIGKSATEFMTTEGVSPEAVFQLGKDLNTFKEIVDGVTNGSSELRLSGTRDPAMRERLATLMRQYEATRTEAGAILGNLQGLVGARKAQQAIVADSEPLRQGLQSVQEQLSGTTGFSGTNLFFLMLFLLTSSLGAFGLLRLYVGDQGQRAAMAESQRQQAEHEQAEAKRVNDANQAAILRLMNELQTVAEGDLTQQATVTEDITGAIADSVNYTVEELRTLVSQVTGTVGRVTETTQQVEQTSTELLAASTEQLREIRETGESVLQMATRINEVSAQAQETAQVAQQSRSAAETGLAAVQDTIGGMHSIRDHIQETSKRIKRLGESSQEIGEITELISDITEQTNVLALNAAIQAASAGEAGRGFSVVAEEVQRLAERSGDATRQIAALVKTIQTDTQDAVAAMERSTQGVVEGTRLSDAAGSALADIDRVSRRLAELIAQISAQASQEAASANVVAENIQHIFAVTEQTGEGTRSTAHMVRELSKNAEALKASVARFKVA